MQCLHYLRKFGQDQMTISFSYHRNNQMQIKLLLKELCSFWPISTKLTD